MRLLVISVYYIVLVGVGAYLVFFLGLSVWWWVLAVLVSGLVAIRKDVA